MTVGCLVITTNLPHRFETTCRLLDSIEKANRYALNTKILSVDLQPNVGIGCENELRKRYAPQGWKLVLGECTGERAMLNNIRRGLLHISDDILFYCEDHVVIKRIPTVDTLWALMDRMDIGWICYNTHIHQENLLNVPGFVEPPGREMKLAYINDLGVPFHWWRSDDGDGDFLIKDTVIADEYYLNFPAAITPRRVFVELMEYGLNHYSGVGIEIGFTKAWFDLEYHLRKDVAIYTKPKTVSLLPFESFSQLHDNACMRFRNNSPDMIHPSVVGHQTIPSEKSQRRSFF